MRVSLVCDVVFVASAIGGIVGGPTVVSTALGFRETPVFAGAGLNPGGKTTYIGAGVRHTF